MTLNKKEKLKEKLNNNKELINWTNKILKKTNIIMILATLISGLTTLVSYGMFNLSTNILLTNALKISMNSFIATCICSGVLAITNGILLPTKIVLTLKENKINKNLLELNNQEKSISEEKEFQKEQTKNESKVEYQYKYSDNIIPQTNNNIPSKKKTKVLKK